MGTFCSYVPLHSEGAQPESNANAALLRHGAKHHARNGGNFPMSIYLEVHPLKEIVL
jgi:hypothetical protein